MLIRTIFILFIQGIFYAFSIVTFFVILILLTSYPGFLEKKCQAQLKRNFDWSEEKIPEADKYYKILSDDCGCIVIKNSKTKYRSPENRGYYLKDIMYANILKDVETYDYNTEYDKIRNYNSYRIELWKEAKEFDKSIVFNDKDGQIIDIEYSYTNHFLYYEWYQLLGISIVFIFFLSLILGLFNIFNYFYPIIRTKMNKHFGLLKRFWIVQNIDEKVSYYFTYSPLLAKGQVKITTNGNVKNGSWEYIDKGKSIIVELNQQQTLYHLNIVNNKNVTLTQDGTDHLINLIKENNL